MTLRLAPAVLLAAALSALPAALAAQSAETPARLAVTGTGRVDAAPDMAVVTLGVQTQARTAAQALADNNARLASVIARLREAGIAPRDVQTSGLSLGPRYDYGDGRTPRLVGYEASNQLSVRVRALDTLGTVLDAAVSDGANTLGGLTFTLADPGPARDAALAAAAADARRKAQLMAEAAGVRLGRVLEITEHGGYAPPQPMLRAAMADAAPASVPVEAGEISYSATVGIVYALAE